MKRQENQVFSTLHKFKKKKVEGIFNDEKKKAIIQKLEKILTNKNCWSSDDLLKLTEIVLDHDIAMVYIMEISKSVIEYVDKANCYKGLQLCALCFSKTAYFKTTHAETKFKLAIDYFLKSGIDLFESLGIASDLTCIVDYTSLEKGEDDVIDVERGILRILFSVLFIYFFIKFPSQTGFSLPIGQIVQMFLSFLTTVSQKKNNVSIEKNIKLRIISVEIWKVLLLILSKTYLRIIIHQYIDVIVQIFMDTWENEVVSENNFYLINTLKVAKYFVSCYGATYLPRFACLFPYFVKVFIRVLCVTINIEDYDVFVSLLTFYLERSRNRDMEREIKKNICLLKILKDQLYQKSLREDKDDLVCIVETLEDVIEKQRFVEGGEDFALVNGIIEEDLNAISSEMNVQEESDEEDEENKEESKDVEDEEDQENVECKDVEEEKTDEVVMQVDEAIMKKDEESKDNSADFEQNNETVTEQKNVDENKFINVDQSDTADNLIEKTELGNISNEENAEEEEEEGMEVDDNSDAAEVGEVEKETKQIAGDIDEDLTYEEIMNLFVP